MCPRYNQLKTMLVKIMYTDGLSFMSFKLYHFTTSIVSPNNDMRCRHLIYVFYQFESI